MDKYPVFEVFPNSDFFVFWGRSKSQVRLIVYFNAKSRIRKFCFSLAEGILAKESAS